MMDDRLKQLMSDTNATLEPYGLTLAIPKIGLAVWHIYYYDRKKKYGSNGMDALFQTGSNVPTLGVVSPPKLKERSP